MKRLLFALVLLPSILGAQGATKLAAGSVTSPTAGDTIVTAPIGSPQKVTVTCLFSAGKPTSNDVSNLKVAGSPTDVGPILVPAVTGLWVSYVLERVAGVSAIAVTTIHAGTTGVTYSCQLNWAPTP